MADNWGFVLTAYGLATVVLVAYWRRLVRREKELQGRSRVAPIAGHPPSEPASRHPLP